MIIIGLLVIVLQREKQKSVKKTCKEDFGSLKGAGPFTAEDEFKTHD